MSALPELYFRVRENGALVFRVDAANRSRRLDLEQIAAVNLRNDVVRPLGEQVLSAAEEAAIRGWIEARRAQLAARELDDIARAVDHLNHVAQWAQARATDAEIEAVADGLLLAMHDLRAVLVRRKADRLMREERPEGG